MSYIQKSPALPLMSTRSHVGRDEQKSVSYTSECMPCMMLTRKTEIYVLSGWLRVFAGVMMMIVTHIIRIKCVCVAYMNATTATADTAEFTGANIRLDVIIMCRIKPICRT